MLSQCTIEFRNGKDRLKACPLRLSSTERHYIAPIVISVDEIGYGHRTAEYTSRSKETSTLLVLLISKSQGVPSEVPVQSPFVLECYR